MKTLTVWEAIFKLKEGQQINCGYNEYDNEEIIFIWYKGDKIPTVRYGVFSEDDLAKECEIEPAPPKPKPEPKLYEGLMQVLKCDESTAKEIYNKLIAINWGWRDYESS